MHVRRVVTGLDAAEARGDVRPGANRIYDLGRMWPEPSERTLPFVERRTSTVPPTSEIWDTAGRGLGTGGYRSWTRKPPPPGRPDVTGALATLALLLGAAAMAVAGADGGQSTPGCWPITYTVDAGAPPLVHEELQLAMETIGAESGFVFAAARDDTEPQLWITWAEAGVTASDVPPWLALEHETGIRAAGWGVWDRTETGLGLLSGGIHVDATVPWRRGLGGGDALAAVLVHELGHVVGLGHSDGPRSFMRPASAPLEPRWTAMERQALATIGRHAGCLPAA